MVALVEQIFTILKQRRFNREKPRDTKSIKELISKAISTKSPIRLVGFWGVGPRSSSNWADIETCNFLHLLHERVSKIYTPGIEFEFIFSEAHGTHNGISKQVIDSYVKDVERLFHDHGFLSRHLDTLWEKYEISFERIETLLNQKAEGWWESIPNHEGIEENAKRRNKRLPSLDAAVRYVIMRDLEKTLWEKEYPEAIFHTFADSKLQAVLPNMPTLYLYARKGWSDTPWFVES